jgi:hypothetical protein
MANHREGHRVANRLFSLYQSLPAGEQRVFATFIRQAGGEVRGYIAPTPEQAEAHEVLQHLTALLSESGAASG